jgi:hypothetical protein
VQLGVFFKIASVILIKVILYENKNMSNSAPITIIDEFCRWGFENSPLRSRKFGEQLI